MVSRLVLGCGGTSRAVVETLSERRGDLAVVDPDESAVAALREAGVDATAADPAAPTVLAAYDPDVVLLAVGDPERAGQLSTAAREAYPDAHLVAHLGWAAGEELAAAVEGSVDAVVDGGAVLARELLDVAESEAGVRTRRFRETLASIDGRVAVLTHDNPDPDAIASAVALRELALALGAEADACYFGEINHEENRALVNLLDLDLVNLEPGDDLSEYVGIALVDHSRPGVNDQLPPDTPIDLVVDHHPPRAPVEARFVDLRHEVGATSTLVVDYFDRLGVPLTEQVATALLYGIRVDTRDFAREVSTEDFLAAATLVGDADLDTLRRVENPSISPETMEIVARAIGNREVDGSVLATYVGDVADRDALAQAADLLLDMDGVSTTLVFGTIDGTVYVSARARGADLDLGETLRLAFDQIGSAGGHADMAGAQIPLKSIVALTEDDEDRETVIRESIAGRFFETVREGPASLTGRVPFGPGTREQGILPVEPGDEEDEGF